MEDAKIQHLSSMYTLSVGGPHQANSRKDFNIDFILAE